MNIFSIFNTDKSADRSNQQYEQIKANLENSLKSKEHIIEDLGERLAELEKEKEQIVDSLSKQLAESEEEKEKYFSLMTDMMEKFEKEKALRNDLLLSVNTTIEKNNKLINKNDILRDVAKNNGCKLGDITLSNSDKNKVVSEYDYGISKNNKCIAYSDKLSMEILSINQDISSRCRDICEVDRKCVYIDKAISIDESLDFKITHVVLMISNLSNDVISINDNNFSAIDDDGIAHNGHSLCKDYSACVNCECERYSILPKSKIRYEVLFSKIDKDSHISSLSFYESYPEQQLMIYIDKSADNVNRQDEYYLLREKISKLEDEIVELEKKLDDKESMISDLSRRLSETLAMKRDIFDKVDYTSYEDDDYFYVISQWEPGTISFNKEFDKTKVTIIG